MSMLNTISFGSKPITPLLITLKSQLISKVIALVRNFSAIGQSSFQCCYGAKEILFDRVEDLRKVEKSGVITHADRVNRYLNTVFVENNFFIGSLKFNETHGSLYIASGVAGSLVAMHDLKWISLGGLAILLQQAANCLFCLANLAALVHHVKIYRYAVKVPCYAPLNEREAANRLKESAVLGIISNLNYILAAALLIIGSAATLALLFGCIAVITGCFKILYDFFRLKTR